MSNLKDDRAVNSQISTSSTQSKTVRQKQVAGDDGHGEARLEQDGVNAASKDSKSKDSLSKHASPLASSRVTRQSILKQEVYKQREKFLSKDLESKRKLYKNKHITLAEIQTWPEYYKEIHIGSQKTNKPETVSDTEECLDIREDLNKKLSIFQGDITTLEIDAIVNAANESLCGGGGVDGAIHSAAGSNLLAECEILDGCVAGDAKITCGYKLPAKYVIHTVGPRGENPKVLRSCYIRCLELLKEHNLKTVAFPCVSTGIFGYPNIKAARIVLKTLRKWLETEEYAVNVERIILCLFLKVDVDIYKKLIQVYFPVGDNTVTSVNNNLSAEDAKDKSSHLLCENKGDKKVEAESHRG